MLPPLVLLLFLLLLFFKDRVFVLVALLMLIPLFLFRVLLAHLFTSILLPFNFYVSVSVRGDLCPIFLGEGTSLMIFKIYLVYFWDIFQL